MVSVTNCENAKPERESHVLPSLGTVVVTVQREANSKTICEILSRELEACGFHNIVLKCGEKGNITIASLRLPSQVAESAEKLLGASLKEREFNGEDLPHHKKVMKGEVVFTDSEHVLSSILGVPLPLPLPLKEEPLRTAVVVPVVQHGLLIVLSNQLKEEELPVYSVFRDMLEAAIDTVKLLERMREQKEFSERIVKSVQEGIMIEDSQGIIIFVNPQIQQMLGYTLEELIGQHYTKIACPEFKKMIEEETAKRSRGIKGQYEACLLHKDGTSVPVIVSAAPLFEEGKYTGTLTVFTDISSQKTAEEEIRTLKEFSENIIQSMHEAIIIENAKGIATFVNPKFEELLERKRDECIGHHWREFTAPECIPKVEEEVARRIHGVSGQYEILLLTKSGRRVPIMVGSTPLFENGHFKGVISVCVDLTVVKEKEKEIKQMNQDLQLLSKINHALNTGEDLKTILDMTIHEMQSIFNFDAMAIMFVEGQKIYSKNFAFPPDVHRILHIEPGVPLELSLAAGEGSLLEQVVKKKESYLLCDEELQKIFKGILSPETVAEIRRKTQVKSAAVLPLVVEDEVIGVMVTGSQEELSQNDFNRLKSLSKHMAQAIDHARLDETFQKTSQELQSSLSEQILLRELLEKLYMAKNKKEVVAIVADGLTQLEYEYFVVGLKEKDWVTLLQIHAAEDFMDEVARIIQKATGEVPTLDRIALHRKEELYRVVQEKKKAIVTDNITLQKETDAVKMPMTALLQAWAGTDAALQNQCAEAMGMQSAICIPLQAEEKFVGIFVVGSKAVLTYHDFVVLETLGQITNEALRKLEYSKMLEKKSQDLEFSNKQLSLLQEINNALNTTTDLAEILKIVVKGIGSIFEYNVPSIYLLSDDRKHLLVKEFDIDSKLLDSIRKLTKIPLENYEIPLFEGSLLKKIIEERKPFITDDISRLLRDYTEKESLRRLAGPLGKLGRVKWMAAIPLLAGDESVGMLVFGSKRKIEQENIDALSGFLNQAALAIAKARMYEELKEANQMKSEFIDIASHELKTPLTSIKLYLEMMKMGRYGKLSDEQGEKIEVLQANAQRLQEIIDKTLVSSRIKKGELDLWKEKVSLLSIINEVVAHLHTIWDKKKQRIDIQKPYKLPLVKVDRNAMWEAIDALLDNAIKYSPEESKITVKLYDRPDEVEVAIMDEGIGIKQEYQKKIFEPFFIVPSETPFARPDGRTGLGLSNAKGIVEKHGGRIWVESVYGLGSTFHFTIPK